ncbi:MAG TPA: methyltransferase [Bacteroidales bacterium]|nr:methyltransferase [Bacteroidales bacterium]
MKLQGDINIPVLIAGTLAIMVFSWFLSIKHGRYHGIARFFAFESIFIMTLLNFRIWFRDPFSISQTASWVLLLSSIYFAFAGFMLLKRIGKPQGGNFENTSVLVTNGLYRYIRHPLYLSLLLLGTGIMLKNPRPLLLALGAINLIALWLTARIEEREMTAKFGEEYRNYMKVSKMFIPYIL